MSGANSSGDSVPSWIGSLKILVPFAGTLATIAADPEEYVREIVAEWVVGGVIDATQYVLGWFIFAYERIRRIILDAIPILTTPTRIVESAVVGLVETIYGAARGVATTAGLAGPPATAAAAGLVVLTTGALLLGLARTIPGSDLVEGTLEGLTR